jgi:hypothetical protein
MRVSPSQDVEVAGERRESPSTKAASKRDNRPARGITLLAATLDRRRSRHVWATSKQPDTFRPSTLLIDRHLAE